MDETDINRLRRQVFNWSLAGAVFHDGSVPWALKGGYVLELRFKKARSTVDIDLTMKHAIGLLALALSARECS